MSLFKYARESFRARVAFTLAEVAVVTGIVLGGGSTYMGVQSRAYRTRCQHNLEQIGRGLQMYEITHGNLPKAAFYPKNPKTDPDSIRVLLRGYEKMFVCSCMPPKLQERGLTFVWNDTYSGRTLSSIPNPSQAWLLIEMSSTVEGMPHPHQGGFNVLYADLHVRWTKTIPPDLAQVARRASQQKKPNAQGYMKRRLPPPTFPPKTKTPQKTTPKTSSRSNVRKKKSVKTEKGDIIYLKNGRTIKGVASWKEEGGNIMITMKNGMKLTLPKTNIDKIVKGNKKKSKGKK